jgi:ribulose-phosphate 3-epimerase
LAALSLKVGVKSDSIEYRYTFPWLYRLMAECGVRDLQLGTFFELYHLPDGYFADLRRSASDHGIAIRSVFTSHRELGGFFRGEPGWAEVARTHYERLIEVAALVGAESVGSNPGSVPRDLMDSRDAGISAYISHMKELMRYAADHGVRRLTVEPMSCAAEPPSTPREVTDMMAELEAHHDANRATTAGVGLCADVSHGYADASGRVVHDHMEMLANGLRYTAELHLNNADASYGSTFGFGPDERERGVVDLSEVAGLLRRRSGELPVRELVGYLEIPGPKLGRDYSDHRLEEALRESLSHCREAFAGGLPRSSDLRATPHGGVLVAPSVMCADPLRLGSEVRILEDAGADLLHLDIMDAAFTPNMPVGLGQVESVARFARVPVDAHLMVMDNDWFIERLAGLGVTYVSVQVESARHLDRTLSRIRELGMRAGAALSPATPLSALNHVLARLDFVLLMMVDPGFAGQPIVRSAAGKIAECRRWLDREGAHMLIEVDGNVSFEHIPRMVAAGADMLVCGSSSVFHPSGDRRANTSRVHAAIQDGLRRRQ